MAHAMRVATLGELAAVLAHELNQPLAAILSNAQAARRFVADGAIEADELRAILDDIVRDDKRAGRVIHNLRGMLNGTPAVPETCCLNDLVREVAELVKGEMVGEKIELRQELSPALPRVQAPPVEVQQVLVNFLLNAVQAMKDSPRELRHIDIETHCEGGTVTVSVRDHGYGIPAKQLGKVFNPFYTTKSSGLGMGLAICRRLIEAHGGRIEARNNESGGATLSFSLPALLEPRVT
jgi:C4-dicarboxylate-specific signal transduction histidine kinase